MPASSLGDPPIIGIARPRNISDANLTDWAKDPHNPVVFRNSPATFSGPSNVWANGAMLQMVMILGSETGLFETADPTLHTWNLVNRSFYKRRGGGGGLFFPLPKSTAGKANYTHMLQSDFFADGTPWFVLGRFDSATNRFSPGQGPIPLDVSADIRFSELGIIDGRMLHMGWVIGSVCLSAPREVTYDANLVQLLSVPAPELLALRGALLGSAANARVTQGHALAVFPNGTHSATFDMEVEFALPSQAGVVARIAVLAAGPDPATDMTYFLLQVNVTGPAPAGLREVAVQWCNSPSCTWSASKARYSFALPEQDALAVRLLVDRTLVEVFVAEGRATLTGSVSGSASGPTTGGAYLSAVEEPVVVNKVSAWAMGCGWATGEARHHVGKGRP